ncbi:ABC transporter permease [Lacrimispora sp. 210928-DFI.3.58]|uniref:ABC transporter permease n=1 Tax=Lacrimispora sp. 210928-DFI.3.58 TaxID=2883214 RepID=UPI001D08715D|nr:ABC transporter permease [Lacrimispora sp. 210928-DFI.3.58]MCB7319768.1 ABC transporter permease [Lacrimispora sp. 210928-DFI.3.58]
MLQSFKLALKSIWGNKMRSFLTMLGIIIGVAAVIILVSIVNGYMGSMVENFTSMGVNRITVNVTNLASRSLDVDDMYAFYEENSALFAQMSPTVNVSTSVKNGTDEMDSTTVAGYGEEYLELMSYELEAGRNLSYADIMSRQKVCIIGAYVAQELYGSTASALNQTIKIGGYSFKVVGIVEAQDESDFDDGGTDDFVWLPYSVAVKMSRNAVISSYTFASRDTDLTEDCTQAIKDFLYETFKSDDYYRVTAMSSLLDSLNEQIAMMSAMLGGIAGISLLVAGVGVMNIMLVSVTERTREIGIRKSLGANKGVIMQQFVIEAAVTSSLGGIIGIIIGGAATAAVGAAMGITATPTPVAVIVSFSVSVGIGLIFGYMPANRAANLNPIDALRSD